VRKLMSTLVSVAALTLGLGIFALLVVSGMALAT
jgi:hypothetical protein